MEVGGAITLYKYACTYVANGDMSIYRSHVRLKNPHGRYSPLFFLLIGPKFSSLFPIIIKSKLGAIKWLKGAMC